MTPCDAGTPIAECVGSNSPLRPIFNPREARSELCNAFRARELGEGHTVEPFISEKQHKELKKKYKTKEVTVSHVLKTHHNQTQADEAREDLSAYQLHIQGLLTMAADHCKEEIQLKTAAKKNGGMVR